MKTCPKCGTELLDNELFCAYCGHRMGAKKAAPRLVNRPRLCRQHKKPRVQDYTVLAGVAQCQRRHSCFRLDALVVVKVDVTVNHLIGF